MPPPSLPTPTIRDAVAADLAAIEAVYAHYVAHSTATFQIRPDEPGARRAWLEAHGQRHPVLVAELGGQVVGWGSLSPFHHRCAFTDTAESSIYLAPEACGRGIGKVLYEALLDRAKAQGHHSVVALIEAGQARSIALHRGLGFTEAGTLREVGSKFGRTLDLLYMQKML